MRHSKTDIIILLSILASIIHLLTAKQNPLEIQFHDTYFILDKASLTVLIVGPLTFLIFLARGMTRRFQTRATNIGLIVGLMLIALITYHVAQFQESYLQEIARLDNGETPDSRQSIVDNKNKIMITKGLFAVLTVVLLLLTLRTIKIWNKRYRS